MALYSNMLTSQKVITVDRVVQILTNLFGVVHEDCPYAIKDYFDQHIDIDMFELFNLYEFDSYLYFKIGDTMAEFAENEIDQFQHEWIFGKGEYEFTPVEIIGHLLWLWGLLDEGDYQLWFVNE